MYEVAVSANPYMVSTGVQFALYPLCSHEKSSWVSEVLRSGGHRRLALDEENAGSNPVRTMRVFGRKQDARLQSERWGFTLLKTHFAVVESGKLILIANQEVSKCWPEGSNPSHGVSEGFPQRTCSQVRSKALVSRTSIQGFKSFQVHSRLM